MAASSSTMEYKRWSLKEEINKLINEALELSFHGLGEKSNTFICKEEYGDYQCENFLSIWPKIIEEGTKLKGPKFAGGAIFRLSIMRDVISHLSNLWNRLFLIEKRDGDAVISAKVEGELESLNFGKREIRDIGDSLQILRDLSSRIVLKDANRN
uniref:Aminoacyl-tRNA synthetase, class 1a, anticodon-binding n=1 Tax=Tanacetum cinerariifolium TaxID=118510 RepID=A0A699HSR5_TANCI|nr:aminoacyl-tRNA synthetase, class 1a, anticodon-binding [Tanacetum cinerariifolium]